LNLKISARRCDRIPVASRRFEHAFDLGKKLSDDCSSDIGVDGGLPPVCGGYCRSRPDGGGSPVGSDKASPPSGLISTLAQNHSVFWPGALKRPHLLLFWPLWASEFVSAGATMSIQLMNLIGTSKTFKQSSPRAGCTLLSMLTHLLLLSF
jgi:hypothetical protein